MPAERPTWAPQHIDLDRPNAARIYDYFLGGACNFEHDRQFAEKFLEILPDAEQGIAYGVPAFKVRGKTIAGFAAFKNHLAYLPHSGSVLSALREELAGYTYTDGSLHFPIDKPLPKRLVKKLVSERLRQVHGTRS
jgi:uncharacterized protein YdhG (YjbR/CyaY superfamily)